MADPKVQAEAPRLWDVAHAADEAITKAIAVDAPEARIEQLRADWQLKNREWWRYGRHGGFLVP